MNRCYSVVLRVEEGSRGNTILFDSFVRSFILSRAISFCDCTLCRDVAAATFYPLAQHTCNDKTIPGHIVIVLTVTVTVTERILSFAPCHTHILFCCFVLCRVVWKEWTVGIRLLFEGDSFLMQCNTIVWHIQIDKHDLSSSFFPLTIFCFVGMSNELSAQFHVMHL